MITLKQAIDDAGGAAVAAAVCEVSPRAIYKWLAASSLPRTEYTGETDYAMRICAAASARGITIDPQALKNAAAPRRVA
ncbi:hypothetical protein BVH06_22010 [Pseudomonas sp. PA27(2017)]|nr:hypothetical protein BVH06_22010 [Pseudomonas sp. PA27(2017)]